MCAASSRAPAALASFSYRVRAAVNSSGGSPYNSSAISSIPAMRGTLAVPDGDRTLRLVTPDQVAVRVRGDVRPRLRCRVRSVAVVVGLVEDRDVGLVDLLLNQPGARAWCER